MGRGRVQLKRIKNKINKQVMFSKRRNGLVKKAHEISLLSDAEVALIIFSTRGKLYEYAIHSCCASLTAKSHGLFFFFFFFFFHILENILEHYEHYPYAEKVLISANPKLQGNWCLKYNKLKVNIDAIQKSLRYLTGEEPNSLKFKEVQQLEQQLDSSMKLLRSRKLCCIKFNDYSADQTCSFSQLMLDSISDLQKKVISRKICLPFITISCGFCLFNVHREIICDGVVH